VIFLANFLSKPHTTFKHVVSQDQGPRLEEPSGSEAAAAIEVAEALRRHEYSEILTEADLVAHLGVPLTDARNDHALKLSMMERGLAAWAACAGRYNKPEVSIFVHGARILTTHVRLTCPRPQTTPSGRVAPEPSRP